MGVQGAERAPHLPLGGLVRRSLVGIDWAEADHDACVLDGYGEALGAKRLADGLEGVARLHAHRHGWGRCPGTASTLPSTG